MSFLIQLMPNVYLEKFKFQGIWADIEILLNCMTFLNQQKTLKHFKIYIMFLKLKELIF